MTSADANKTEPLDMSNALFESVVKEKNTRQSYEFMTDIFQIYLRFLKEPFRSFDVEMV